MGKENRKQIFHPIEQLPMISQIFDEGIMGTQSHYSDLLKAKPKPHVLDDETVDSCIRLYKNQMVHVECFEREGEKWLKESRTTKNESDAENFLLKNKQLRKLTEDTLLLLDELRKGTIDRIREMDDAELGLRYLMGEIKLPE